MPVQAHVQAYGGACLAGSGLDKVTHLVDEPQAVAAQQLVGRRSVPGERIGEVASVGHLADELSLGLPDLECSAAVRVAHGVGRELADGDDQVGDARLCEPGTCGPAGDEAANRAQVVRVAQRLGVYGRAGKSPVTSRRNVRRPQVADAGCGLAVLDDGRMRAYRIGDDRSGKPGAVVRADNGNEAVAESQVDERLVPDRLSYLCGRAAGPDRLADAANAPAIPLTGISLERRGDPPRGTPPPG